MRLLKEGDIIKRDLTDREAFTVSSVEDGVIKGTYCGKSDRLWEEGVWEGNYFILADIRGLIFKTE